VPLARGALGSRPFFWLWLISARSDHEAMNDKKPKRRTSQKKPRASSASKSKKRKKTKGTASNLGENQVEEEEWDSEDAKDVY